MALAQLAPAGSPAEELTNKHVEKDLRRVYR